MVEMGFLAYPGYPTHSDTQDCSLFLTSLPIIWFLSGLGHTHLLTDSPIKTDMGDTLLKAGLPALSLEPLVNVPWNPRPQLLPSHTATTKTDTKVGVPP